MFDLKVEQYKESMVHNICDLIKIPSVSIESGNPTIPFGDDCKKVLDYILELGQKLGFRTKNVDNYCGYIEFGQGDELLGIIGHLDVVPGGDGWTICNPFEPKIVDNKIYGRGAIDDKGPVIASLYAMKIVMDTCKVNKRIRLILGLNEEKSWKCIEYYKSHEEHPTLGFSPDADFPCIYAEKGLLSVFLESSLIDNSNITIENIDCKNNAINVVPKYCEVSLKIHNVEINEFVNYVKEVSELNNYNISIEVRIK